ncbi:Membrane protein OS=Streptomyces microflavus OX=1919 GN=Smic_19110 PE=4 SV=1 [Streptomyces microflavus]|uniref:Membrane protein n=2 Tax=Streptomyces microflavus TaxID=1919 RepID=A0A7J0CNN8_STRMI|nr:Integral membrane protein [Streptomyces microflavus DSM 40593]GFN03355.1 membrane protein [Streptomyces microflavus]
MTVRETGGKRPFCPCRGASRQASVAGSFPPGSTSPSADPVPLGFVFRSRAKEEKVPTDKVTADLSKQPRDPQSPKGRPTPKRSEAQTQRRRASSAPTDRKAATKRQREARRADLARQREALASGDERYLPVRDKGPVRRFVRDFVDSRFCIAEYFLPLAVVILILSVIQVQNIQSISLLLWMGVIILIVIDSIGLSIRLKKQLRERFPDTPKRGAVAYGLMRTLQMRRLRLPKPQVKRGERP